MIINVYPVKFNQIYVFLVHKQVIEKKISTIINAFVKLDIMMMEKINYAKNVHTNA